MSLRAWRTSFLLLAIGLAISGCGPNEIDTSYGRSRGTSINGTSALAEILRQRGHEVRVAVGLTDTLAEWADVVVRFAPYPGAPDKKEGQWLFHWLENHPGHKVVYVPRDFDAESEFWDAMLAAQAKDTKPEVIDRLKQRRERSKLWVAGLPPRAKETARSAEWFTVAPKPAPPAFCQALEGPWAEGIDTRAAAVSKHETFQNDNEEPVLLSGDGSALVISWTLDNGSQGMAVANASFLLNASLLNKARRPLAMRVVDWIGPNPGHVAFLEGSHVVADSADSESPPSSSPFHLLTVKPFDWIAVHLLAFLLLLALAYAVRLGRPSPEPPSGVEKPSAHPEALGALLARTGRADAARALLEAYRRWRHPSSPVAGRTASASPSSRRVPRL